MKIAYISAGRMPTEKANGYQSAQMCQAFLENNIDLHMYYPGRRPQYVEGITPNTTIEQYYSLRMPVPRFPLPVIDWIHWAEKIFGRAGRFTGVASILTDAHAAMSLARVLRAGSYDRVYVRSRFMLLALVPLLRSEMRRRVYFEAHSLPNSPQMRRRLIKVFGKIGGVVALTAALSKELVNQGLNPKLVCVEHDGVDLESFRMTVASQEARRELGISSQGKIAAYIGKFHTMGEEKGIPEILRAAGLLKDLPDLTFYFIGGPMDRVPVYLELIRSLGVPEERFVFVDRVSQHKVALYMKAADVLLMPFPWSNHYAYYMSPLKLFEYMAGERPIVATKLPSVEEVLRHEHNALLAEPGDPETLASSIRRLTQGDSTLSQQLSNQALEDVEDYTWKKRAARILQFMNRQP